MVKAPAFITLAALLLSGCGETAETLSDAVMPYAMAGEDTTPRVVSRETDAVSLTIYPDNLALVTETRTVTLPAGRSTVQFDGVSDLIIPQTLILREFTGGTLERNFDYDLLGRASLFEESVGDTVRLTRIDAGSGKVITDTAEIVSANARNGVVVRTDDGLEGLFCSGLKTRTSFTGLPPGLAARPAMNVEIETESAGEQTLVISYLTTGMDWEADYRLDLGDTPNLLGWLSVQNGTSKRYEDIDLSVIAGQLNRQRDTRAIEPPASYLRSACWTVGSTKTGKAIVPPPPPPPAFAPQDMLMRESQSVMMDLADDEIVVTGSRARKAVQEDVGDYKLYRIPRNVTVGAMQTKQLAFLEEADVGVDTRLVYDLTEVDRADPVPLSTRYDIDNSREDGLAMPLPEGNVRVFANAESGRPVYLGEDEIDDLPINQDAKIVTGRSVTVFARSETTRENPNRSRHRVTFGNAGDSPAVVELEGRTPETRVSGAERVEDEDSPTWRVTVPANDSVEVDVRIRYD